MATIYENEKFDQICFGQYQYLAFKTADGITRSARETIGGVDLIAGQTKIVQIGQMKNGGKSSGYSFLKMEQGFLTYAGRFENFVLFAPDKEFPKDSNGLIMEKYVAVFVAFADLGDWFCFITSGNASRLVSKDFILFGESMSAKQSKKAVKTAENVKSEEKGKMRKEFYCNRCYKTFKSGNPKPKYCGKCKSSLWNVKRTYSVALGELPTKKRTKPTGKAARNQSPEYIRKTRLDDLLVLIETADREYQQAVADMNRTDWQECEIGWILYRLETFLQAKIERSFEYWETKESDKREIGFGKRGTLYAIRENLDKEIARLFLMIRDGKFYDHDPRSVEQYQKLCEFDTRRQAFRDQIEKQIESVAN